MESIRRADLIDLLGELRNKGDALDTLEKLLVLLIDDTPLDLGDEE